MISSHKIKEGINDASETKQIACGSDVQDNKFNARFNKMKPKVNLPKQTQLKQIDNRWSELKLQHSFSPRQAFGFCSQGNIGYLHGGYNCDQGILGDMYMAKFNDPDDHQWHQIKQSGLKIVGKLRYHTLTSYLSYLICVGGQKSQCENNGQVFSFNLKTSEWSKLIVTSENGSISPQKIKLLLSRDSHCAVRSESSIYVFGGYSLSKGEYLNSTLKLNLAGIERGRITLKQLNFKQQTLIPEPRANFASCFFRGCMYIFGGTNSVDFFDDFWSFECSTQLWNDITTPESDRIYWPQKRKGACLVSYPQSLCLILFGGMQTITREQNDLSVYLTQQKKWVKVHSNTNNIYDISPTLKQQVETSPTIISHKAKRKENTEFRIGIFRTKTSEKERKIERASSFKTNEHNKIMKKTEFQGKTCKTQTSFHRQDQQIQSNKLQSNTSANFFTKQNSQQKMSVVRQKKYREFMARKKKLLIQIYSGYKETDKRSYSPTSQCLNHTLSEIGEQHEFGQCKNPQFQLPKVIFDDRKLQVIGKKPCARDGHAAFSFEKCMYIIGGDRHMISFNDTHLLRLDKTIESLSYYS